MTLRSVRVRLLPWRPKVRDVGDPDPSGVLDLGGLDDLPGIVVGLVVGLAIALLLPFVLVALVFSLELALVLLLVPFVMVGQLVGLLPWVLVLRYDDGRKRYVEVTGTRAMLARRRGLLARIGTSFQDA